MRRTTVEHVSVFRHQRCGKKQDSEIFLSGSGILLPLSTSAKLLCRHIGQQALGRHFIVVVVVFETRCLSVTLAVLEVTV